MELASGHSLKHFEDHQISIADRYYSWGWLDSKKGRNKKTVSKIRSVGVLKMQKEKIKV